jgi:hypothetical protein
MTVVIIDCLETSPNVTDKALSKTQPFSFSSNKLSLHGKELSCNQCDYYGGKLSQQPEGVNLQAILLYCFPVFI